MPSLFAKVLPPDHDNLTVNYLVVRVSGSPSDQSKPQQQLWARCSVTVSTSGSRRSTTRHTTSDSGAPEPEQAVESWSMTRSVVAVYSKIVPWPLRTSQD